MADNAPPASTESTESTEKAEIAPSGRPIMSVKVYAPFHVYYEGDAYSVSAVNDVGPFDILPKHRNFLCMLVPCVIKIQTPDKGEKTVKINRALMHVKADRVVIFVDV